MINSFEGLLEWLIQEQNGVPFKYDGELLLSWYQKTRAVSCKSVPLELESLYCGFFAKSIGQAFASSYQIAIQRLTGVDTCGGVASFCVTENKSTHPTSMQSCLSLDNEGRYRLSGKKDFVTLACEAKKLFVAVRSEEAKSGEGKAGRNIIKLVEVDVAAPGVNVQVLPTLPFVSDVSHGVVSFDSIIVDPASILSGDGYADYVKPFRWFEDINVFMSVSAYLFKLSLAFGWPVEAKVEMVSLLTTLSGLHKMKADDPIAHIVMFDQTVVLNKWLQRYNDTWSQVPEEIVMCCKRDLALLKIAGKAREARYTKAMTALALV